MPTAVCASTPQGALYEHVTLFAGDRGSVTSAWYDRVSYGKLLDVDRAKPGAFVRQRRFLDPNDGYTDTATIHLAQDDVGAFFVFVEADVYNQVDGCHVFYHLLRRAMEDPMQLHVVSFS